MLDNLRSQREEGKFCDIFLHVGGKRFAAHRSVLAASSPYFETILRHEKTSTKEEITIDCEDGDSFEILLDYIYSGNITIDEKNVDGLLRLSTQFLITKLQGHCEQYLELTGVNYDDTGEESGGGEGEDEADEEEEEEEEIELEDVNGEDRLGEQQKSDKDDDIDENQDETNNHSVNSSSNKRMRKSKENNVDLIIKEGDKCLTADDEMETTINEATCTPTSLSGDGNNVGGKSSNNRTPSRRKIKSKYASDEWISDATPVSRRKSNISNSSSSNNLVNNNTNQSSKPTVTGEDCSAVASIQSGDDEEMLAHDESSDDQRPVGQTASLAQWREGIKCPHCSYIGHSATRLEQHLYRVHEEDTTYKCRLCDFTCKWNREYYRHMKCHFDGPPYKCEDCDYTCDRIQFILSHRMRHTDERPFNCEMCPFKSRTKGNLIVHMRIHTGEKPYKCQFCDRGFAMKNTLDQHLATHREDRPFLCDTCGFTTKYQSHLLSHKRIHTGNVFHCTHEGCNYFSPRRSQLAAHERSHSSIRSHICVTCGRGFIEKSHLIRHERIHLEDKPFKCDECDYESTRRDKLKEHVLKHHSGDSKTPAPYKPRKSRRQSQVTVIEESSIPELSDSQLIVTSSPGEIQITATEQEVATANLIYEYQTDGVTPITKTLVIQNIEGGDGDECYLQLTTTTSTPTPTPTPTPASSSSS